MQRHYNYVYTDAHVYTHNTEHTKDTMKLNKACGKDTDSARTTQAFQTKTPLYERNKQRVVNMTENRIQ